MSSADTLFRSVTAGIPSSLPPSTWYLIAASALIACGKPEELSSLYLYATGPDSPLTETEKTGLSKSLQDMLAKAWTLVGIPLIVVSAATLAKVERKDNGASDGGPAEQWQPPELTPETTARGTAFMQTLYKENLAPIFTSLGSNGPLVEWLDRSLIYGLFLADHRVLSPVESELVILTCIMCQGLRAPTMWHMRGLRRLGVSEEDAEAVQSAVEAVARWAGRSVEGWARVRDVRDEV